MGDERGRDGRMNGNPLRARRTPPPPPVYDASLTRLRSFVRSSQRASVFSTSSKRNISANASRPIWYPGNESEIPAYLDGSLAGDYGFGGFYMPRALFVVFFSSSFSFFSVGDFLDVATKKRRRRFWAAGE